jgi:hypothetical protein
MPSSMFPTCTSLMLRSMTSSGRCSPSSRVRRRPPARRVGWSRSAMVVEPGCCTMRRASPGHAAEMAGADLALPKAAVFP